MIFKLESTDFKEGGIIPMRHTCDGEDYSPNLSWGIGPEGTQSFILIMDDPDAPMGTWDHWVLYNIPADCTGFPEGAKQFRREIKSGLNSWNKLGYGGPCPPDREHRYFFKLYALDKELDLGEGATKQEVEVAMQGHILAEAQLMGRYNRPGNPG